ncbi:MAG TPA: hypothetical protein DEP18_08030 [Flavobacteriales bacterium]|nr:hypothetical protein [Flavobacteriales bacterium]HRE76027.1 hypothetical protein [Flavobacteriales bacterium]HRJ36637.1 hypothetical protein [Flavobacteriales bacterium]HRJ39306.1 hypothetical protein [Flavobacteriales bacterium]
MKKLFIIGLFASFACITSAQQVKSDTSKVAKGQAKENTVESGKTSSDTTKNQQRITVNEEGVNSKKKNAKLKNASAPAEGTPPEEKNKKK